MKATFLQRFLAYIIDVMLLSIILSIISSTSINSSNYNKLLEEQDNNISKLNKTIDTEVLKKKSLATLDSIDN